MEEIKIYQDRISEEFERLKNLPQQELVLTEEEIQAELERAKQITYENKIVALIREKYNINQELALLRQKDTKAEEYNEYYAYVEECKAKVKNGGV